MRIGIIAMGRSGGYNLGQWISYELGYPYKHEPYLNGLDIEGENVIVKWLYTEWNEIHTKPEMDKWIGLWRENVRECAISHLKANELGEWRSPYTLTNEWINERESDINESETQIRIGNHSLKRIPQIESFITYEGIYNSGKDIQKVLKYLDIKAPKYLHLLDSSNRLRKDKRNKPKRLI